MTHRIERRIAQPFAKGHGAKNDFIILPDPDSRLALSAADVVRLCDRRAGIGADGILRAVRCAADSEAAAAGTSAEWFMDYRNADGSKGAMCGNGLRVLARYLVDSGLCPPGPLTIATRAGTRQTYVPTRSDEFEGDVTVLMGRPSMPGPDTIEVAIAQRRWPAVHVDMGNPHAVVFVDDLAHAGDLHTSPTVTPADAYPAGVTVEFVTTHTPRHLALRVHERGVGETRACGTGACAAVAAALHGTQQTGTTYYTVDLPGGRLRIAVRADGTMELNGPAEIVAQGTVHLSACAMSG
ncbi:diaminopimelate epimerase [Streptantibioticus ferralitis]|uniref:Diaminopimelate epimerase n=1 Tax=Streptantibioticus ferralitis TaxID=236510 RepID=A0ABT5ZB08_9ACTN|nr:diaminopimelate epimerase [Streptantibioticus ferralitis]MDF2260908.1 diaminopimelate epimerase [Streptantibioticus ferralitis]